MLIEVDVLHVVFVGPTRSMGQGLGAVCRSKWLTGGRPAMRIEVDVVHVVVGNPAR
jgi:hypothetical protein